MIANITQNSVVKFIVNYNERKVKNGKAERLDFNSINPNSSVNSVINQFAIQSKNSKRKDKNMHISINFQKDDFEKLNKSQLVEIADKYLLELGFPKDHLRIIYQHFDTNNPHIHIVTSKIVNGKSIKDNHLFRRSQRITRSLEEEYKLKKVSSKKVYKKVEIPEDLKLDFRKENENLVSRFRDIILFVNKNFKATSFDDYNLILNEFGIKAVEVKKGVRNGLIYIDINGKYEPIKSSKICEEAKINNLKKSFLNNGRFIDKRKEYLKYYLNNLLSKKYDLITLEKLKSELLKIGYEAEFITKGNRIGGWRFTDLDTSKVYKASEIDRNLSFSKVEPKIGLKSKITQKYSNEINYSILIREYKEINGNLDNKQQLLVYLAQNGMIPIIKGKKVFFNYYRNKNTKEKDYTYGFDFSDGELNTKNIAEIIYNKKYKYSVFQNRRKSLELKRKKTNVKQPVFNLKYVKKIIKLINDKFNETEKNMINMKIIKSRNIKQNDNKIKL